MYGSVTLNSNNEDREQRRVLYTLHYSMRVKTTMWIKLVLAKMCIRAWITAALRTKVTKRVTQDVSLHLQTVSKQIKSICKAQISEPLQFEVVS